MKSSLFWVCPTFLQKPLTDQLYNISMGHFFPLSLMKSVQSGPSFWMCHWNFSVHMSTYCWGTYSSVLWSFTSHAAPNHNWAGEFTCFLQEVIWICFGFSGCKFHFIPSAALGHFLFSGHIPEIFLTSIYSYLPVIFLFRLCLLDVLHTTNWENVHNVATVCIGLSSWRTYNNHSVFFNCRKRFVLCVA